MKLERTRDSTRSLPSGWTAAEDQRVRRCVSYSSFSYSSSSSLNPHKVLIVLMVMKIRDSIASSLPGWTRSGVARPGD
ncbi:hypothetical protein E2C01_094867 [Portunus trituberculatus]|uniref:Uncharacterized protein n=1 Tax=Portunus trituberculatus TaxID=210409 RepID=A0A5B7K4B1_PORTR|nr:hypothetical protein [Portunus trituberculatus]